MTKRATFTQAELVRAIRAAEAAGKVALQTRAGIAFIDPAAIPGGLPEASKTLGNSARVGKHRPVSRQWVTGTVGKYRPRQCGRREGGRNG